MRALNDALNAAKIDRAQAEAHYQQAARSQGLNAPESLQDGTVAALQDIAPYAWTAAAIA